MPLESYVSQPESAPAPSPEPRRKTHGRRRVLVADPDDRVQAQLKDACLAAGYAAETVPTGRGLLDAVRRMPVHLVVVSLDLPDMLTSAVIDQLHAVCPAPPVIILSPHGADPRQGVARDAVSACIFKPVDTGRFLGTCERVLRLSEQHLRDGDWRFEARRALAAEVTVEIDRPTSLTATLVNLSARGFRIELPEPVGVGRIIRVTVRDAQKPLAFEARLLWEKPLPEGGTLAGGDVVGMSPEDKPTLTAMLQPLG
jgi:DNA-binding response OmpR family regulator